MICECGWRGQAEELKQRAAQVNARLSFLNTLRPGTVEARFFMET